MAYDAGFASGLPAVTADPSAGYVTLGTRDLARALRFYEPIAREIGVARALETEDFVAWGLPGATAGFGVALPEAVPALERGIVPLQAEDPDQVQRLYEIALEHGGSGEGAPRDHGGGFYAAYFRDPDGNRLNAFCITQH
jgi:catechol 2,3-dioxygenase-like lactoylglutathione lyase family enzyme